VNISEEKLIDFDEAAKLIPGRDGGTAHKVTLMNYTKRGLCGVRLESVLAGPGRCTSVQAAQRFIDAVNEARNKRPKLPDRAPVQNRTKREAALAARLAAKSLENSGA